MELSINSNSKNQNELDFFSKITHSILIFLAGIIVSCYYFPFEFTFLPGGLNTKIILAAIGIPLVGFEAIKHKTISINKDILFAILIALFFSIIGYISTDINNSKDYSYANYIFSFATWLLAAYATCVIVRRLHGYFSYELLINYLIGVCLAQCFLALAIDYNPTFKLFIDTYISQDTVADVKFLNKVDRLYGIGAAVDVAGTRFSVVLIGLISVMTSLKDYKNNISQISLYWIAFITIAVIGNMISRTTIIGVGIAFIYLFYKSKVIRKDISYSNIKASFAIATITTLLVLVAIYYYQTDRDIQDQLRFAFEGFFNLVEEGEWRTDSTDKLNNEMWKWPESTDTKTWLIGKAIFDNWGEAGTDIGYCRFVFYNGIIGLITFSFFFIYNAWVCQIKFPKYRMFFIMLLILGFVIWLKVSTDLFIIYALFFCIDKELKEENV